MNCKPTSLCVFDEQDVQTDIISNSITDYHPITSITSGGPIEFFIPGSVDEYIDFSDLHIQIQCKILKADGKDLDATDKVCFVNQPLSSIFQDVFLMIGDKQVEGGQHMYAYNGYLSSLLQFHPSAKKTHMQAWGWNEDDPGEFNADTNEGIKARSVETEKSKVWEIMGPVFFDFCRQQRYLLPQTDVRIKFLLAKPEFALQVFDAASKNTYIYKITNCVLYARRIRVNDNVISSHNKGLERMNAKYPIQHIDINSFTITKGTSSVIKDHLYPSQTPKVLIIGCIEHEAFNGNIKKSPFNFEHFDLNKIGLYRDGELVPGQIFYPDYDNDQFVRAYIQTMTTLNYFNTDDSNGITLEHFKNGYNLYAFDLTPDANGHDKHRSVIVNSSLRLELGFKTPLAKAINVMLFGIFDGKIEITKLRDIILSYNR
jgi:hypothetical protein